LKINNIVL